MMNRAAAKDPWRDVRADFPTLQRQFHGKPLCYLDSAATSQKPQQVVDAMVDYYTRCTANVHRAVYELSAEATEAYEGAREKARAFVNARSTKEVVWTKSATEALNLVRYSYGLGLRPGDKVLATMMEHHSNFVPWQQLARRGVQVDYVGLTPEGLLDLDDLDAKLTRGTKLVTLTHASNVLGTINPVREVADRAHEAGALVLVDGAQSAPHLPVDVQAMDCDFFAVSGHKMLGPTGIGFLWARERVLEEMDPFLYGGDMIREVTVAATRWNELPYKFEAGTQPIAEAIGLGAAIDYLQALGMERVRAHERDLTRYALEALGLDSAVRVFGPKDLDLRGGVVSFALKGVHPHDVASILDQEGLAVRSGHHCAQPLMQWLGVPATTRASFYVYNTEEDVDRLVDGLGKVKHVFGA